MKALLKDLIESAVKKRFPEIEEFNFTVETTNNPEHGDFAANIAMQLTRILKKNPREIASQITEELGKSNIIKKIDIAGPGFINIFLNGDIFHSWLGELIKSDTSLKSSLGNKLKVMVEFVSANPTGPLHIGHGRGAAIGDSVARIMEAAGYDVYREYYVNDAGVQMSMLSKSVFGRYCELYNGRYPFPDDGYKGEYIYDVAKQVYAVYGDSLVHMSDEDALNICRRIGIALILNGECTENGKKLELSGSIAGSLKKFNVVMDEYFSEKSVYESGEIDSVLANLKSNNAVYDDDGALWLATEAKGDEKDRVLKKSDGTYTYLTPDIAYHANKLKRGFKQLIDVWGADHHGYVKRMECALEYIGHNPKDFTVILVQMVNLLRSGEKAKMSTRAGEFIELDWLIDEVGVDAARYFYNMRSGNSQFNFDVDLAKTKSSDNPVYYIQYCHARVCSLLAGAEQRKIEYSIGSNLELLTLESEINIIKKMMNFKPVLESAALAREPHKIAYYLQELAAEFHSYYYTTQILDSEPALVSARLTLVSGVAKTIKFGLSLLGVSAPERM